MIMRVTGRIYTRVTLRGSGYVLKATKWQGYEICSAEDYFVACYTQINSYAYASSLMQLSVVSEEARKAATTADSIQ